MAPDSPRHIPRLLLSGLDSLYVSYYLDLPHGDLDFDELAYRKERVQQSRFDDFAEITLGSETFALPPFGKYPYRYILANDAFEVRLSENLKPGCHVQFYSQGLWLRGGLEGMSARFADWCGSLRLTATREEVVSRADWAFDYALPEVDFLPEHFVSRAAKSAVWHEHAEMQTVSFGTGGTVIRLYDKVAEIRQQSAKAFFFELWGETRNVWRIEFQLRRERLKRAGIRTIETLKDYQHDVLRELATKHTTLRRPITDGNRSRWPLHPLWKQLQRDIAALPQTGLVAEIDPRAPLDWRIYQQGKSIYGMLKGLGALLHAKGQLPEDLSLNDVTSSLESVLRQHYRKPAWDYDIQKRIKAYRLGQW